MSIYTHAEISPRKSLLVPDSVPISLSISISIDNNNNNGQGRIGGPSVAEDPTPEAKKTCLRDDDVFIDNDDADDDDQWTLCSMSSDEVKMSN
jgi:hypothetical protein